MNGHTVPISSVGVSARELLPRLYVGVEVAANEVLVVVYHKLVVDQFEVAGLASKGSVHQFVDKAEKSDDLTMLAIQYIKPLNPPA